MKELFTNKGNTVGIVEVAHEDKLYKIAGFFNKELLAEMTKLFDLFDRRDVELYTSTSATGDSAILLVKVKDNTFLAVCGKTECLQ